jgi:elongation factor Ts
MEITAQLVKQLRERTGAGMMECKAALTEAKGDLAEGEVILRKKGISSAAKKSSRSTKQGVIASYIHPGAQLGVLIEVNCESDFVARTEDFQGLANHLLDGTQVAGLQLFLHDAILHGSRARRSAICAPALWRGKREDARQDIRAA